MELIKDVNQGDVLTFKANDGKYKGILCTSTYKQRSPFCFEFAALTYDSFERPQLEDIRAVYFYGKGNIKDDYFKYSDVQREKIWEVHPEIKPYSLGSYGLLIARKDFMKFRNKMEYVGNLRIVDHLDKNGRGGMNASNWDLLADFFVDQYKSVLEERGQNTFKVEAIVVD
jgi:hypothetical protein